MKKLRLKSLITIAIVLCWHAVAMATISVHVDPPTVQVGETFRLVLTLDDQRGSNVPNLIPLQKNFTIVGTERSMLYSITNGQTHSVHQWIVLLTAKHSGTITIPPLQIGPQQSAEISINVSSNNPSTITSDADQQGDIPQDDVMMKTEVSLQDPLINQQVIYTVKLYNSQRLVNVEYIPPHIEDSLLVPLGESHRYQTTLNGRNYAVEEQQYAIFPQKSGPLTITSPTFKAVVFDDVPRRISADAPPTQLVVKPIPADYSGKDWLPASQVALTEIYDQTATTMKQGSTLVRTITLQAAGVPAQLLPVFEAISDPQFNAYADKPGLQNTARQQELVGRSDIKVTYLLNQAGHITIPAYQVAWFNTTTGKTDSVTLPARTMEVEAVIGHTPQQTAPAAPIETKDAHELPPKESSLIITIKKQVCLHARLIGWITGGLVLVLVLALAWQWFCKGFFARRGTTRLALKTLHEACVNNNPNHAQLALLHWAQLKWPGVEIINLHQLTKLVHHLDFKKQVALLSRTLYGQDKTIQWQGKALWRSVTRYQHRKPTPKSNSSQLPPINPA